VRPSKAAFNIEMEVVIVRIVYDSEVDALRIIFRETTTTCREIGDGIALDIDAEGNIAGIEILDAGRRLGERDTLRKVTLEGIGIGAAAG